jgi:hypothetical protein
VDVEVELAGGERRSLGRRQGGRVVRGELEVRPAGERDDDVARRPARRLVDVGPGQAGEAGSQVLGTPNAKMKEQLGRGGPKLFVAGSLGCFPAGGVA